MPFFSRSNMEPEEEIIPTHQETELKQQRGGLFGSLRRDRDPSPVPSANPSVATNGSRVSTAGFSHSRNSDAGSIVSGTGSHRSFLHRSFGHGNNIDSNLDPSILQARERVLGAENAEREADRALDVARREVREARDHVKRLELEAKEEARRAKVKQFHAREVSKRAKPLGRHDL
ncbi:uncharacterized protein SPSK_02776 [Sporothrix schenckii 1099-18]|uniref:Uncharacterized protein n=2 Tax=Sporothrix schenckii TaxID=29908 RepID=U7PMT4_SPOS1|nr:uncharacterized protein SPSK_02776 [Sporothrix schenckii 1099-18]ERS96923.1 hypothetical protein HMPREF1624_06250 [Sporothrix schenckii ATCC 58251]KJR86109.1 hypothetical protein SPSK_02776 [Sporothrix schenckii 1099-18]